MGNIFREVVNCKVLKVYFITLKRYEKNMIEIFVLCDAQAPVSHDAIA